VAFSRFVVGCFSPALLVVAMSARAWAVHPSELLLPATTKGFISTHDVDEVRNKFNETQLGEMVADPLMKPFIDDLKQQIKAKLEKAGKRLGIKWDDMEGVYGGEVAGALIQPDPKDKMSHATALIVDITGKKKEADELLKKIDENQKINKAKKGLIKEGTVQIITYEQPLAPGEKVPERSYLFVAGDQLIVTDHEATIRGIVHRLDGNAKDTLASVLAFGETLKRCQTASPNERYHVRWFVEPFGYAEASRAAQGGKKKRGTDLLKIVQTQGFNAIQGVGGHVFFATNNTEVLHRTFVFAPAVNKGGNYVAQKYNLAMRMLDFPNSANPNQLEPPVWALPDVATYLSFNWKMREAFDYSETLVDAVIGDKGAFKEIWLSLKSDVNGPQIDIYKELLEHLGTRFTLLSDVKLPVDLKSERLLSVVELKGPGSAEIVTKTLEKAFKKDPQARRRTYKNNVIWEITQDDSLAEEETELMIEGVGFVSAEAPTAKDAAKGKDEKAQEKEEDETKLPNMALTVFLDHLIVATHVDFIQDFIAFQGGNGAGLAQADDYQRVRAELNVLGSNLNSFLFFSRTDESYRATYELMKDNKLPQAETMLARLLNGLFGKEEGVIRQQEIDGSKLPDFEQVKKYLGPGGLYTQSEDAGWWVVGCLLKK
jgi:hypothetical protein